MVIHISFIDEDVQLSCLHLGGRVFDFHMSKPQTLVTCACIFSVAIFCCICVLLVSLDRLLIIQYIGARYLGSMIIYVINDIHPL